MSGHQHGHDHAHQHSQHGSQASDFEWAQWAEQLELEATTLMPLIDDVVRGHTPSIDWPTVQHVLDLGCGPGVISCALAQHAPHAHIAALDSSVPLLARVRHHANEAHLATRVHTLEADMEAVLPALRPMDVVWAGMVLHHVADHSAVLRNLLHILQPGGTLVIIEFADPPTALPVDDPALDAWNHMEAGVAASRNERIGLDPLTIDWPKLLAGVGYESITDAVLSAHHDAPLDAAARWWLQRHVERGVEWLDGTLSDDDVAQLTTVAADISTRDDLTLRHERRVLTARRPLANTSS
jgi:SAM-dependent methyltransferase